MFNKLKQVKEIRDQAKQIQDMLSKESVTVTALGGKLDMTMDGNLKISSINIDESLLAPANKAKLEKAIADAHGDAMKKVQRIMAMKMKDMGGMPDLSSLT